MRRNFWIQVQNYMRKAKFRRKVRNILAMLAVVTVFTTTYALILPAITLENSVPLAGFDANEGKTPEELAAEAERQAAAEAAAAEESGNGAVDADPASFVGSDGIFGEDGQNPAADGETPPPTPPDSVEVSGEVSGEFSSDNTDYPSIEGFTMNAEGRVFDSVGNEIDPARLSEAQRQSLLADLQNRSAEEALANYHMNGAGQVLDANEQLVDPSGLSPETLKALEQKYIDEVLSLYHMDKDGQILDVLNQPQDPATFSAAALVALREKSQSDAAISAGEDSEKEPGSHDLSLYKMLDNGRIVSEDGTEIPAERFSEEELDSLKKAWSERVLAEYTIDENGDVKNAQGETIDSSAFPEELLLALRQKAADSSEALPYALKMYMDQDLVIKDGFTHEPVSEEKLNELSAQLRDILYGFEVNYDARLEVKDRYTAGLRAQGLDVQAESVASSAAPMAEAGRQQTLAANAQRIAAGEAALDAEVQVELAQVAAAAAESEALAGGQADQQAPAAVQAESEAPAGGQADQQVPAAVQADQQVPGPDQQVRTLARSSNPAAVTTQGGPAFAPIPPQPPAGLDPTKNTLAGSTPQPYYYYTSPDNLNNSGFVRISVEPFREQTSAGFSYTYPTGAAVLTHLSFSNADGAFSNKTVRVYVKADQADPNQTGSYNPPGDLNISGHTYPVHSVTNPNGKGVLYYYDINNFPFSETGQVDTHFLYPNGTLGGNTTIWAEKIEGTPTTPEYANSNPGSTDAYMNVPHVTEPRQQQVSKSGTKPNFQTVDGTSYVTDLGFTVQDTVTGTRRYYDGFGEIRYLHNQAHPDTIVDVLTLPEGIILRDGLVDALSSVQQIPLNSPADLDSLNVQGLPASFTYPGTLLTVTIGGQQVMLAYFEESRQVELTYTYTPSLTQDGKLKIEAKAWYKDPSKPADFVALWNAATPLRYRLGDTLVKLNSAPQPADPAQIITNDVDYTLTLENNDTQTSHAQAKVTLKAKNPHLTIKKTALSNQAPNYFGEPAGWEVTAENDSTYNYSNLKELTDTLSPNLYLSKNDLYKLFTADPGFAGQGSPTVTISGATLVNTPAAASLPNATGGTALDKNAQTHGDQTPYDGLAATDPDQTDSNVTLKITRSGDDLVITTTDSNGQSLSKTVTLNDLQGITNSGSFDFGSPAKSFIVTKDAQYRISWPYQINSENNYSFAPGEKHTYQVPTTVKDSFMLLAKDQRNAYPSGTVAVNNNSDGSFAPNAPSDDHSVNGYASHPDARREAGISKKQSDTNTSGVSQFTVHATHQGTGTPDVLTISDHLKASFASFLVKKSDNPTAQGLGSDVTIDGDVYGAITEGGTYVIGKDQESNNLTAEVTKQTDNTWLVKWHFAKADIGSNFSKDIQVYTYVDPNDQANAGSAYSNEVWMNDHATHRLYDSAQRSTVSDFKKNIVTSKGLTPDKDVLVRSSRLNAGDTVTYRLEIHGKANSTINAAEIYDLLPKTPDNFSWSATDPDANVICNVADIVSENNHVVHNITGITVSAKNGTDPQKLTWTGTDPLIAFNQEDTLHIYVKLTFPTDAPWNDYVGQYSTSGVDNTFHVFEGEDTVHHMLGNEELVYMRKSCIQQQILKRSGDVRRQLFWASADQLWQSSYWNSPSYYSPLEVKKLTQISEEEPWRDRFAFVTYQVGLFNPSSTENMYLSDMEDTLPDGFKFGGLMDLYRYQEGAVMKANGSLPYDPYNFNYEIGRSGFKPTGYLSYDDGTSWYRLGRDTPIPYSDRDTLSKHTVAAEIKDEQHVVFKLSNLKNNNNSKVFHDDKGWYLPPKQGLFFSYFVIVENYEKTKSIADNKISMKYTPPKPGIQPKLVPEDSVHEGVYGKVKNIGHTTIETSGDDTYLVSDAIVQREPTQIGISKRYTGAYNASNNTVKPYPDGTKANTKDEGGVAYFDPQEQLKFQVDLKHQSGVVQDWTFTEMMEAPYGFDEIKFYPQDYNVAKDALDGTNPSDLCYTFKILERADGQGYKITLTRPPLKFEDSTRTTETLTLGPDGTATFGGLEQEGKVPNFTVSIKNLTKDGLDYQQIQITPEKGYFGYTYHLKYDNHGDIDYRYGKVLHPYPKFDVTTSVHRQDQNASPKLYENVARLTPSVPISDKPVAGHYENGNGVVGNPDGPSVIDGELVPVFGSSATGSNKSVTQLDRWHRVVTKDGKEKRATGSTLDYRFPNEEANTIVLPDETTPVRYTLRVKNLNETQFIKHLVLADNLPQQDDRGSWRNLTPRQSEFKVNFSDPGSYPVTVKVYLYNNDGTPKKDASDNPIVRLIDPSQYTIQYSDKTTFGRDPDFTRENDPGWYTGWKQSSRSFRIWLNETGTPATTSHFEDALIPPNAVVEVSYDAEIDSAYVPAAQEQTAWNSFGYRYQMNDDAPDSYLEAEPKKVGISVPKSSSPSLIKQRLYGGNPYPVIPEEGEKSYLFLAITSDFIDSLDTQLTNPTLLFTNLAGKEYSNLPTWFQGQIQDSYSEPLDFLSYQFYKVPVSVGQSTGSVPMRPVKLANGSTAGLNFSSSMMRNKTVYLMEVINPSTGNPYFVDSNGKIKEDQATSFSSISSTFNPSNITVTKLAQSNYPVVEIRIDQSNIPDGTTTFTGTNEGKPWNINLLKTDGTSTTTGTGTSAVTTPKPLLGALFGLYSSLESEQMTDLQWQDLKSTYNLPDLKKTIVDDNGTPYYLKAFSDGSAEGESQPFNPTGKTHTGDHTGWNGAMWTGNLPTTAHFDNLQADRYLLRELRAPEGYKLNPASIKLERSTYYADKDVTLPGGNPEAVSDNNDAWALVSNTPEMGETLPETGGIGRWPFILGGLFFLLVAGAGLWSRRRQAALEAAPPPRR